MSEPMNPRVPGIGLAPQRSMAGPGRRSQADVLFDAQHLSRAVAAHEAMALVSDVARPRSTGHPHGGRTANPNCAEA